MVEVEPLVGEAVPMNMVVIVVPRKEAAIDGILLGRNVLLHHGFSIDSIPNVGSKGPRYLPQIRLPQTKHPVPFLTKEEVTKMKDTGELRSRESY